ncbi:hypothetical protein FACS1894202_10830 [Clostridia bacterium]|nr:hypothetical protein FACS1894202_10830 [Clostridia bacterium]
MTNPLITEITPDISVSIAPLGTLESYQFTVIFAQYGRVGGGWLYARRKDRDTWETAGGHIEPGETPLDCAKRELYEETGAASFIFTPRLTILCRPQRSSAMVRFSLRILRHSVSFRRILKWRKSNSLRQFPIK